MAAFSVASGKWQVASGGAGEQGEKN